MLIGQISKKVRIRGRNMPKNIRFIISALIVAASVSSTGCAGQWKAGQKDPLPTSSKTFIEDELTQAADRTQRKLAELVALNETQTGRTAPSPTPPPASGDLAKEIVCTYDDDVKNVLRDICRQMPGWRLVTGGREPLEPIIVHVSGKKTIFAALEDIGWQLGNRAHLHVDGASRTLRLGWQGMREPAEQVRHAGEDIPWNGKKNTLIGGIRRNLPKGWKYRSDPAVRNLPVKTRTDRKNWRECMRQMAAEAGASIHFDDARKLIVVGR